MQRKQKKLRAIVLLLGLLLGTSLFAAPTVYATEGEGSTEKELTIVDTSLGITYMYAESDTEKKSPTGINLNGNSVIIEASANGNTNQYNNFYIDKDRDGVLDDDEKTKVVVGGSTDVIAGPSIYGVFQQKTTTPISITVNSGYAPSIYGVLEGEMAVSGETGISLKYYGGIIMSCFGAQASTITVDGARAIDVIVDKEATNGMSVLMAAFNSDIKVMNADTAGVSMVLNDNANSNISTLYTVCSCTYTMTNCKDAAVDLDVNGGTYNTMSAVVGSTITSDGANATMVDVDMTGGNASIMNAVLATNVDAGKKTNMAIDVDMTGTSSIGGEFKAVVGTDDYSSAARDYVCVGNVDVNINLDAIPGSGNRNFNSANIIYTDAVIDGDVNICLNNVQMGSVDALDNACVKGNYTLTVNPTCTASGSFYGMLSSVVDGNVEMVLSGNETNSSYYSLYGVTGRYKNYDYVVGGDCKITYTEGNVSELTPIGGSSIQSNDNVDIKGNVEVSVKNGVINSYFGGVRYVDACENVTLTIEEGVDYKSSSNISGVYESNIIGDITVNFEKFNTSSYTPYVYGLNYTNVTGDAKVTLADAYAYGLYGMYYGKVQGNLEVFVTNMNRDKEVWGNCYGAYYGSVNGNMSCNIDTVNFSNVYGTYEITCGGNATTDLKNVVGGSSGEIIGIEAKKVSGTIQNTMENIKGYRVKGVHVDECENAITNTITKATASYEIRAISCDYSEGVTGDVICTINDSVAPYLYGVNRVEISGGLTCNIKGGTYGTETSAYTFYGVTDTPVAGEIIVNIDGAEVYGTMYPYQASSAGVNHDAIINITGLTLNANQYGNSQITNNAVYGQKITMDIDDTSSLPDGVVINPDNSGLGTGVATYGEDIYYGGMMIFSEDVTYDSIHFTSGNYLIKEGVTVKVNDELYVQGAKLLIEGKLDGKFAGTLNSNGKFTGSSVYMNGGTLTQDLSVVEFLYYPIHVNYLSKGGLVTKLSSTYIWSHPLRSDVKFAEVGDTLDYTISIKEGYHLESATIKSELSSAEQDVAVNGTTYTFDMPAARTDFNVVFTGNPIVLGKTVADPVATLNSEYTEENPVYDLNTVSISNDGLVGEVEFKVDAVDKLPEGLIVKDNKIYGVPTVAYEEGKKSVIHVTGKNGAMADLVLNIVVTAGEGKQTSQDGRLTVDEDNEILYLNGNSVVIETQDNNTAIFMDDNRDRLADSETPAFVGDLTNYIVYGVRNTNAKNPISITMNGGTIATIYGAYNGTLPDVKDTLVVYLNGGSLGTLTGLSSATTDGTMDFVFDVPFSGGKFTGATSDSSYGGYFCHYKKADSPTANFYGTYSFAGSLETKNVWVQGDAKLTIEEGASVTATGTLYRVTNGVTYLKGNLSAGAEYNKYGYYGYIIVQGGTLPEGSKWAYVYYPIELSTNLKSTTLTPSNNTYVLTENGKKVYYLNSAASSYSKINMSSPAGFDYYYSLNGGEYEKASDDGVIELAMPRQASTLEGIYIPKQISVEKQFADPIAKVDTEYTVDSPLYDLSTLKITDDTTVSYGGEVKYTIKNQEDVPSGLTFDGTKLIGTPTEPDEEGQNVTIIVTGRNGTTAELTLNISVMDSNYKETDINEKVNVNVSGKTIDLQGTSVVIVQSPVQSGYPAIYLDENHDKIADNDIPLRIDNKGYYSLSAYTIYGYKDSANVYDGDISITIKYGSLHTIYGVYGSMTAKTTVNGNVTINMEGGSVNYNQYSGVYGSYYGVVDNVTLEVVAGTQTWTDVIGAYESIVNQNVNYKLGGTVTVTGASSTTKQVWMHAAKQSEVAGDVNIEIGAGAESSCFSTYTYFYGLYDSSVSGNVNCVINGYWDPTQTYLTYKGTVGKDIDVDWNSGTITNVYCSNGAAVTGDILVDAAENATISGNIYAMWGGSVSDIYMNIPESVVGAANPIMFSGDETVGNSGYIRNKKAITVAGNYVIEEDIEATNFKVLRNSNVTIAEGVTVSCTPTANNGFYVETSNCVLTNNGTLILNGTKQYQKYIYGTIVNNGSLTSTQYLDIEGTVINNGKFTMTSTLYVNGTLENNGDLVTDLISMDATGMIINRESGVWEVVDQIYNEGKIVNYGTFNQTCTSSYMGYGAMGKFYTTKELNLYNGNAPSAYTSTYFYYPVTLKYPSNCVDSASISGDYITTSGVEGDDNQYIKANTAFYVTVGNTTQTATDAGISFQNVTYGSTNKTAVLHTDGTYIGTSLYEPFTISVNYSTENPDAIIELDKYADTVSNTEATPLIVGTTYTYNSPLYDVTKLVISNDIAEGTVEYYVDSSSALPEGLSFKDGKLYGTLKEASVAQDIVFVVKGKNQTSAFFTLTIGEITKQLPVWSVPTGLTAKVGYTLADVYKPYASNGTYSWIDSSEVVSMQVGTVEKQLQFTPKDTENYDWEKAAENVGATYTDGVITCTVSIAVSAAIPSYTVPTDLEATYEQTFGEIELPADGNGAFSWTYDLATKVGSVGTRYYYVNYIPTDTTNYQTVNNIRVQLTINRVEATFNNTLTELRQDCGITLADIILPDVEGGKYQWITTATTIPINGTQYQAGFKPSDTTNYDWTGVEGWSNAWGCVVFPVTVYVNHTYEADWTWDDDYHWHACTDETCESQGDKAEHEWIEGEVIVESTLTTEGSRKYNCDCGAEKTVVTPVLPHDTHTYAEEWSYNTNCHWKECTFEGCNKTTMPVVHTLNEGIIEVEPTDRQTGLKKYSCECGYYETEVLDKLPHTEHTYNGAWEYDAITHWRHCDFEGCQKVSEPVAHVWDKGMVITAATETTTGTMKHTCECGASKTETIPVLTHTKHTYNSTWTSDANNHWHVCTFNGCTTKSDVAAHTWDAGTVTKAATTTAEGEMTYTCTVCKQTKKTAIPKEQEKSETPGTVLPDNDKDADYVVIATIDNMPEVSYKFTNKNATKVVIPDTIVVNGVTYKVTAIADNAFKNHKKLKSVKMGANMRTIGKNAFYGCKKLTSVTIGKNVTTIGDGAFQNCTTLKKITIPAGVITIGKKAFYGCKKLATVKMGKNVETIKDSAFQNCTALKKIEIPSKVKAIGKKAFYNCKKLTSINIKSQKLTTKNVKKQAFTKAGSSNYKKLTVKVPKKKKKAYKTMLKKCGLSSKAKVK